MAGKRTKLPPRRPKRAGPPVDISQFLKRVRASGVRIGDKVAVATFLKNHPSLLRTVESTCRDARAELPAGAELELDVYRDPELDDRYLVLYARQAGYAPDLVERIEKVAERHPAPSGLAARFLFTTDFQPPRHADALRLAGVPEAR